MPPRPAAQNNDLIMNLTNNGLHCLSTGHPFPPDAYAYLTDLRVGHSNFQREKAGRACLAALKRLLVAADPEFVPIIQLNLLVNMAKVLVDGGERMLQDVTAVPESTERT